jgi:hypothetical protein
MDERPLSSLESGRAGDDCVEALVRWRLADPAWQPSFAALVDDVRACMDMSAGPAVVLSALGQVLKAHPELAPRARMLAEEASGTMAARMRRQHDTKGGIARRIFQTFRPAAFRQI